MTETNNNPQISLMKWMLEDIRKVTISGVEHLSKEQLFTPPIEGEYCIGSYLMHLAEADLGWLKVFTDKDSPEEIKRRAYYGCWYDSGPDSNPPKEALEVKEYFNVIAETRKMFLDYISNIKDTELEDIITRQRLYGERSYSKKWIIYHIIEHEGHTRGQMFMLIRKAGWNKKK